MSNADLTACLEFTLQYEGGFVNNPSDPGGATNMGITQATLSAWRGHHVTVNDVRALERPEVDDIYREQYWSHVQGNYLPIGVDLCVFDYAVNSGVVRSIKALQAAVGVPQDGHMGLITMDRVDAMEPETLIRAFCARRLSFLEGLKTWNIFGKGWAARVHACQALALKMRGQ